MACRFKVDAVAGVVEFSIDTPDDVPTLGILLAFLNAVQHPQPQPQPPPPDPQEVRH